MRAVAWLELPLLVASLGCGRAGERELKPLLMARLASPFVCRGETCLQAHPRLPDTGEWRCAEHAGVAWCAGGEPAAGVVAGRADSAFQCAPRWGHEEERICIARHPDYPEGRSDLYQCSYAQERGTARRCKRARTEQRVSLPEGARPACWLDRDCDSGACDRGACVCSKDAECGGSRCRDGWCAGGKP